MLVTTNNGKKAVRVGAQKPDTIMPLYNHKTKVKSFPDWKSKDKPLAVVEEALKQLTGDWEIYTEHIIPEHTPISDQKGAGTCSANAWCDMLEILDGLEGKDAVEQLSRRFLYWCARYLVGDTNKDDGMFNRAGAHQLMKIGVVQEKHFPYSDDPDYLLSGGKYASPELDLYTMASNNRISSFFRPEVSGSLEMYLNSLEVAIRSNHPIVFGAPIDKAFVNANGYDIMGPAAGDVIGWHAMIIVGVGFDGPHRKWLVRNSWGKLWGNNGHTWVNDGFILSCRDLWVGTRMGELV